MATLTIPDETPVAELNKLATAMGKRLQYRTTKGPKPETANHGHNRPTTVHQPALRVVDSERNC